MILTSYYIITCLALLRNAISDYFTRKIDSRWNYFAMGATLMLIGYFHPKLLFIFALLLANIATLILLKRYFAAGDLEALAWIYLGLGTISMVKLITFLICLTAAFAGYLAAKRVSHMCNPQQKGAPGYVFILISYIIAAVV